MGAPVRGGPALLTRLFSARILALIPHGAGAFGIGFRRRWRGLHIRRLRVDGRVRGGGVRGRLPEIRRRRRPRRRVCRIGKVALRCSRPTQGRLPTGGRAARRCGPADRGVGGWCRRILRLRGKRQRSHADADHPYREFHDDILSWSGHRQGTTSDCRRSSTGPGRLTPRPIARCIAPSAGKILVSARPVP